MDISNLLEIALEAGASDLHLSTDLPPILRIDGEVQKTTLPPLDQSLSRLVGKGVVSRDTSSETMTSRRAS
jgi:twitching motility protein PilT